MSTVEFTLVAINILKFKPDIIMRCYFTSSIRWVKITSPLTSYLQPYVPLFIDLIMFTLVRRWYWVFFLGGGWSGFCCSFFGVVVMLPPLSVASKTIYSGSGIWLYFENTRSLPLGGRGYIRRRRSGEKYEKENRGKLERKRKNGK